MNSYMSIAALEHLAWIEMNLERPTRKSLLLSALRLAAALAETCPNCHRIPTTLTEPWLRRQ